MTPPRRSGGEAPEAETGADDSPGSVRRSRAALAKISPARNFFPGRENFVDSARSGATLAGNRSRGEGSAVRFALNFRGAGLAPFALS